MVYKYYFEKFRDDFLFFKDLKQSKSTILSKETKLLDNQLKKEDWSKKHTYLHNQINEKLPKKKGRNFKNRIIFGGEYISNILPNYIPTTPIPEEWKIELPQITKYVLDEAKYFRSTTNKNLWGSGYRLTEDNKIKKQYTPGRYHKFLRTDNPKRGRNLKGKKVSPFEIIESYFANVGSFQLDENKKPIAIFRQWSHISFVLFRQ